VIVSPSCEPHANPSIQYSRLRTGKRRREERGGKKRRLRIPVKAALSSFQRNCWPAWWGGGKGGGGGKKEKKKVTVVPRRFISSPSLGGKWREKKRKKKGMTTSTLLFVFPARLMRGEGRDRRLFELTFMTLIPARRSSSTDWSGKGRKRKETSKVEARGGAGAKKNRKRV